MKNTEDEVYLLVFQMSSDYSAAQHFVHQIRFRGEVILLDITFCNFLQHWTYQLLVVSHLIGFSVRVKNGIFCQVKQG